MQLISQLSRLVKRYVFVREKWGGWGKDWESVKGMTRRPLSLQVNAPIIFDAAEDFEICSSDHKMPP